MVVSTELKVVDSLPINDELANTGYTIKWTLTMLHEHNPKFVEALGGNRVKNLTAKDISEAKGYLSRVFRVVVEFEDPDAKEYSFVMKVPTMDCLDEMFKTMKIDDSASEQMRNELEKTHRKECEAYELIANIKNFPKADTYYLEYKTVGEKDSGPGVIVMEDLCGKATTIGLFRSVSEQHCLNLARHFGTFQAQINFTDGWKGKYLDSFHTGTTGVAEMSKFTDKLIEYYKYLEEPLNKMTSIDVKKFSVYSLSVLPREYNAITLCQGDCWANNIMICTAPDGSVMDKIAAIIDWQIVFESNPMFDIARFMCICADAEIRRDCEERVVNLLYDTFCEEYKKMGKTVPYTREQAHELYDYAYIHQAYGLVGMACFMKIYNKEKVSEHTKEAQAEKIVLRTRLGLDDALERMQKYNVFERFQKSTN